MHDLCSLRHQTLSRFSSNPNSLEIGAMQKYVSTVFVAEVSF